MMQKNVQNIESQSMLCAQHIGFLGILSFLSNFYKCIRMLVQVITLILNMKLNLVIFCVKYCECFASGIYCDGCNCVNCHNNIENEAARREAVEVTLERNSNAFRPKIASSPHGARDNRVGIDCLN